MIVIPLLHSISYCIVDYATLIPRILPHRTAVSFKFIRHTNEYVWSTIDAREVRRDYILRIVLTQCSLFKVHLPKVSCSLPLLASPEKAVRAGGVQFASSYFNPKNYYSGRKSYPGRHREVGCKSNLAFLTGFFCYSHR